ncbi:MAG: hypothetical protein A2V70_04745 [Planctomycetes bacterium RBG_13_63_9]|nr:MAG: hypothetical protein A2V70_04745 [Planctomycetes bacterium RBG_13_63_9]
MVLLAVMAAAWIAAGAFGLLGHPLRHALTWVAMAVAVVAGWPHGDRSLRVWASLAAAILAAVAMTASDLPTVNILAVGVLAAALAICQTGTDSTPVQYTHGIGGRAILTVALAAVVLGIFRLASDSIPAVWLLANGVGQALGSLAGWIAGRPLWVGASFGGVDFLVLMAALYTGWLACTSRPRLSRAVYAAAAILLGHLVYLVILAFSDNLLAALPEVVLPEPSENSRVGVWAWGNAVRTLLPWNLPVLAGIIHLAIAAAMFRWAAWAGVPGPPPEPSRVGHAGARVSGGAAGTAGPTSVRTRSSGRAAGTAGPTSVRTMIRGGAAGTAGPTSVRTMIRGGAAGTAGPTLAAVVLALLIPLVTVLAPGGSTLKSKTILVYQQGHLQLPKPEYDNRPEEAFGMLRVFVESLDGNFATSPDLSELVDADADSTILVLMHPDRPWTQDTLRRVWEFVRRGGSLVVVAGPKIREGDSESSFNALLEPTAMEVRYDTAVPATAHWEDALASLLRPATAGIGDGRNRIGLSLGSSIRTRWPARPVVAGRWGWSDPGSDAARTARPRYDPGEELGDLVLAAEQRFGRGTIVVLADGTPLENEVAANSYVFTGRLLGDLAGNAFSPQAWWRGLLGLLGMVGLVGLLAWRPTPGRLAVAAVAMAVSLTCAVAVTHWATRVLPDGHYHVPNNVAYIDASHMEAYCTETWDDFGLGGLTRSLMRSGYLPLMLPELTGERLKGAGLLISIAPARAFSAAEREAVREFVREGGSLICMVGAEEAAGSRELLADFGFEVLPSLVPPDDDTRESTPLGKDRPLSMAYVDTGEYKTALQTYAPWEIDCSAEDAQKRVWWPEHSQNHGLIIHRIVGKGMIGVIGDTFIAANQNLESQTSALDHNVVFWRWFLSVVAQQEEWTPPNPSRGAELPDELPPVAPAEVGPEGPDDANSEVAP